MRRRVARSERFIAGFSKDAAVLNHDRAHRDFARFSGPAGLFKRELHEADVFLRISGGALRRIRLAVLLLKGLLHTGAALFQNHARGFEIIEKPRGSDARARLEADVCGAALLFNEPLRLCSIEQLLWRGL